MSKFNESAKAEKSTVNHMGAKALKQPAELELVSVLLTSFANNSYYRKEDKTFDRLKELIQINNKEFAAKAAVYARTKFGMRSITHVMAAELAKYAAGTSWGKNFYDAIIYRPDDMLEIASYYFANCAESNGNNKRKKKGLTNSMKAGFAKAIGRFNAYELAKYRGDNKTLKLVDLVNMVHPVGTTKNGDAIKSLIKGELKSSGTWESELSRAGQIAVDESEKVELKKEVWIKLIKEKTIGIFAVLRNLRNIFEQAPEAIDGVLEILTDEARIKKSLILPFRYLTAYAEIEKLEIKKVFEKDTVDNEKILKAIEKAVTLSIANLPVLTGKTIILSDNSFSMRLKNPEGSVAQRSTNTQQNDIANLFALMYWTKSDNTLVGLFGDQIVHPNLDRSIGLFDNFKKLEQEVVKCGGETERGIFDLFERLIREKIIADTIVIFSDCQIGSGCKWYDTAGNAGDDFMKLFSQYKKIAPNFRCFSVDLKNYGSTVFDGSVIKMAGWSEKIFDIMKYAETDQNALVNEVKKINLDMHSNEEPRQQENLQEAL